ncbi:cation:proton antiporter [Clostridium sp. LIBA-8841]|uniref:cation:proton antiporter n=1 Tax=Clostridium sp. LIBA-8841 TaxID=2987530 RepID=UPI002AC4BF0B|nr:cation:proton antiporter [Clostridium sp. LIBA-8841]MDZ5254801.1 cation:proton antiporter [Clostridium sp. LIBA-8841]
MIKGIILLAVFTIIALMVGKLVSKLNLPSILGWLLTGMIIGPHALNWMNSSIMDTSWFHIISNVGEVLVGMLIGAELILEELKKSGKQILTICLFEGMTAFIVVTVAFLIFADVPISIALIFGAIALATAPAPSLSIVKEYNAKGPVSKTLIPLAALDDVLALIVFFLVIGVVSGSMTGESVNIISILMMIILPLGIGAFTGIIGAKILQNKKCKDVDDSDETENKVLPNKNSKLEILLKLSFLIGITVIIGRYVNDNILSINLLLSGISFFAIIVNKVEKERLNEIMELFNPIIGIGLVVMVVNLGAPLDYNLIFGAGLLTVIYIVSRGIGKILGAYTSGKLVKADDKVCKYLGLSLLPHSGVSLIFTGIAVDALFPFEPEYAMMIQGTIAAAAVINEIIAVFLAKQAFKMSGEIQVKEESNTGGLST